MPISPELQAKIDALDDEELRARITDLLTGPYIRNASDEQIFENSVSTHRYVKEHQAKLRRWTEEEVLSFVAYMKESCPDGYADFVRQENALHEIDLDTGEIVIRAMLEWEPGLEPYDQNGLLRKFRQHINKSRA